MARSAPSRLPILPVMPLRSTIVFPTGVAGVQIGSPGTIEMLAARPEPGLVVAAVVAPGGPDDPMDTRELQKVAVAARVADRLNLPGGTVQLTLHGIQRVRIKALGTQDGYLVARVAAVRETPPKEEDAAGLIARILNALEALSGRVERISREVPRILRMNLGDPGRFTDLVATLANFSVAGRDQMLQTLSVQRRMKFVCDELESQLARVLRMARADAATASPTAAPPDPSQRANDLRQQIRLLQAELGEVDPAEAEAVDLLRRVEAAGLPVRAAARARAEVERLRSGDAPGEVRAYVEWLVAMPWRRSATDGPGRIDLARVQRELDDDLVGLNEPKERLLDHLAVARLRKHLGGAIPCIVGPPDVGKYSLAAALARGLGRPIVRLDLRGRVAPELIGIRRTRGDTQPGRIAALMRDARVNDPVLVLDEPDEIIPGKGDEVTEVLEEILVPDNRSFTDRFLDVPFDLADVLFLAIAQDFQKIPRALREKLVEIRIAGYTPEEKVEIAKSRLLPRLIKEHGLRASHVVFPDEGLYSLAYGYARDAGIGNMRRAMETLLRTRARARARGDASRWTFDQAHIEKVLGVPRYVATAAESTPEVGVVTGLAWTSAGGELMFIEALRMPGSGRLIITGMLGDAMRESVNAAYSYVRSRGPELRITEEDFREHDIHVHFPVGAIPKDGPSAGVAVTLAIASTLSNRPVRHDIAVSGEVTLRGKVLEVGGVKEKVLAAHRADLRHIVLPAGNERDLRDVPANVRNAIRFHFVERMDDVIRLALHSGDAAAPRPVRFNPGDREPRVAQPKPKQR
jgi:ATP-dependent Lon protease